METEPVALLAMDSPVSNNGRGLKQLRWDISRATFYRRFAR